MNPTLRPMSLGEILDRAFQLYRRRFLVFVAVMAIPHLALLVLELADMFWWHIYTTLSNSVGLTRRAYSILSAVVMYHLYGFVGLPFLMSISALVQGELIGERRTLRSVLGFLWARFRAALWLAVLKLLAVLIGPELIAGGVGLGLVFLLDQAHALDDDSAVYPALVVAIFVGVVFCYLFYKLAPRLSLAFPVAAIEGLRGSKAMRRSWSLSKDASFRLLLAWIIVLILNYALATGTQLLVEYIWYLAYWRWAHGLALLQIYTVTNHLVQSVVGILVASIYPIAITLLYYDQRIRREGFDVELMMQAAGMEPAAKVAAPTVSAPPTATEEAP